MTQTEAHTYFTDYAAAFIEDATKAADRFLHVPLTIVERDKAIALTDKQALMENFARLNDANTQMGLADALIERCEVQPTKGDNVIEATVGWRFINTAREDIYAFETRYVLCDYGDGWKITVAVNVDA
ncbi:MAG: hypothetical protein ACE363_10310 [Alphaproteobacteria bacterium]